MLLFSVFSLPGFIYDKSNSYDVLFYVVGTIEAIGAGFVFVAAYKAHNRN